MAPQIGADHVVTVAEGGGDPVPVTAMIAPAMQQDQRRRVGVAPIDVMHAQALGEERVRGRAWKGHAWSWVMGGGGTIPPA